MLTSINFGHRSLSDYNSLVSPDLVEELHQLAAPLKGLRVNHVNATAFGGGVAEILYTLAPLMQDVGLDVHWNVLFGRDEYFNVTKAIHNGLQGDERSLTDDDKKVFERYSALNAGGLKGEYDVMVIHDAQPAGIREYAADLAKHWLLRLHIDLSTPNADYLDYLLPMTTDYDAAIFHMQQYVPDDERLPRAVIMPPAIDALAPKNIAFTPDEARRIVGLFGPDPDRPLILQVSRFDPWKDPLGVIDAWRLVREQIPGVQLALLGSMAADDPEGMDFYRRTVEHANEHPDIFIMSNLHNVGSIEVNAFQTHADVVLQKSIREGFGLTVTEALWKGRPVVAGNVGGIPLQVIDGETGYLVDSVEQTAERCVSILKDPVAASHMGLRGKEHVRKNFLMPRLLRDYLRLFADIGAGS